MLHVNNNKDKKTDFTYINEKSKMEGLGTAYNVKVRHNKAPILKSSRYTNVSIVLKNVQLIHNYILFILAKSQKSSLA